MAGDSTQEGDTPAVPTVPALLPQQTDGHLPDADVADAVQAAVQFPSGSTTRFAYDTDTGTYGMLHHDGSPQLDANTGIQAAFDNLLVLYSASTPRDDGRTLDYDLTMGGGLWLNGGHLWHITWTQGTGSTFAFYDADGRPLRILSGRSCESEATGRDREDQPDYKVKMSAAFCFSNKVQLLEYYHNSSWLEHGGSPEHAVRTAFVYQINKYLKDKNLYKKGESAISFQDVQDCLVYVSSSFSTRTSYENQTKKAITNKFVSQAMTDFLKHYLEVYFLEKPDEAQKICQQVLVNKQSREHAEKTRQSIKKTLSTQIDLANRVQKFVDCRTRDSARRELYIVEGDSAIDRKSVV